MEGESMIEENCLFQDDMDTQCRVLKEKIIHTDKLLKCFASKSQEYDTQTKKLESTNSQLENANKELQELSERLQTALSNEQPLIKSKEKLEKRCSSQQKKIEQLQNEASAFKNQIDQLHELNKTREKESIENEQLNDAVSKANKKIKELEDLLRKAQAEAKKWKEKYKEVHKKPIKKHVKGHLKSAVEEIEIDKSIIKKQIEEEIKDDPDVDDEPGKMDVEDVFREVDMLDCLDPLSPLPPTPYQELDVSSEDEELAVMLEAELEDVEKVIDAKDTEIKVDIKDVVHKERSKNLIDTVHQKKNKDKRNKSKRKKLGSITDRDLKDNGDEMIKIFDESVQNKPEMLPLITDKVESSLNINSEEDEEHSDFKVIPFQSFSGTPSLNTNVAESRLQENHIDDTIKEREESNKDLKKTDFKSTGLDVSKSNESATNICDGNGNKDLNLNNPGLCGVNRINTNNECNIGSSQIGKELDGGKDPSKDLFDKEASKEVKDLKLNQQIPVNIQNQRHESDILGVDRKNDKSDKSSIILQGDSLQSNQVKDSDTNVKISSSNCAGELENVGIKERSLKSFDNNLQKLEANNFDTNAKKLLSNNVELVKNSEERDSNKLPKSSSNEFSIIDISEINQQDDIVCEVQNKNVKTHEFNEIQNVNTTVKTTALNSKRNMKTNEFNEKQNIKRTAFNEKQNVRTTAFNERQNVKTTALNERQNVKTTAFNEQQTMKTTAFREQHYVKTTAFNERQNVKTTVFNEQQNVKTTTFNEQQNVKVFEFKDQQNIDESTFSTNNSTTENKQKIASNMNVSKDYVNISKKESTNTIVTGINKKETTTSSLGLLQQYSSNTDSDDSSDDEVMSPQNDTQSNSEQKNDKDDISEYKILDGVSYLSDNSDTIQDDGFSILPDISDDDNDDERMNIDNQSNEIENTITIDKRIDVTEIDSPNSMQKCDDNQSTSFSKEFQEKDTSNSNNLKRKIVFKDDAQPQKKICSPDKALLQKRNHSPHIAVPQKKVFSPDVTVIQKKVCSPDNTSSVEIAQTMGGTSASILKDDISERKAFDNEIEMSNQSNKTCKNETDKSKEIKKRNIWSSEKLLTNEPIEKERSTKSVSSFTEIPKQDNALSIYSVAQLIGSFIKSKDANVEKVASKLTEVGSCDVIAQHLFQTSFETAGGILQRLVEGENSLSTVETKVIGLAISVNILEDSFAEVFIQTGMNLLHTDISIVNSEKKLNILRLLSFICKQRNNKEAIRVIAYDIMVQKLSCSPSFILAIASIWPHPLLKDESCWVLTSMEHIICDKLIPQIKKPKLKKMTDLLCDYLNWRKGLTADVILAGILKTLTEDNLPDAKRSITLLVVHMGWSWANNTVIVQHIWPALTSWATKTGVSEQYAQNLIALLGVVMSFCPASEISASNEVLNMLIAVHKSNSSKNIHQACTMALLKIAPLFPQQIMQALNSEPIYMRYEQKIKSFPVQ